MLAERWWFWAAVSAVAAAVVVLEPRWRRLAAQTRERALRRGLVEERAAAIDTRAGAPWSETWLPGALTGAWVCASPWVWGYDDVEGAVLADVASGAVIVAVSLAGVVFPALLSLNLVTGLWLVTAPWLVGFGTHDGPVGLSDVVAGLITCALALRGLGAATRRLGAAPSGPVGRISRRHG